MKAISLHGPWAYYERANAEKDVRIQQLQGEVSYWKALAAEAKDAQAKEEQRRRDLEDCQIPALRNETGAAADIISSLQAQLDQARQELQKAREDAAQASAMSAQHIDSLLADNVLLKEELRKHMHLRQNLGSKIEDARKRLNGLGLTSQEAELFIKDLDDTKAANKALRAEVAALSADKAHLQQQCESRSSHAMTLISENKRLLEQVAELRRQVVSLDQDTWRLKQDLAAAQKLGAKVQKKKEAAATARQERPEWQDGPASRRASTSNGGATAAPSTSAPARQPGADLTNYAGARQGSAGSKPGSAGGAVKAVTFAKPGQGGPVRMGSAGGVVPHAGAVQAAGISGRSHGAGGAAGDQARLAALYQSLSENVAPAGAVFDRLPPGAGMAVQAASDRLEALRTAALQQALAARQQRLVRVSGPM
uniref:Uncharacterized protein n=1 Tax=Chlamydomonas leiostraca TaxID=1034604 RepID=A0A7S0S601_9CHLO|mmetsp:Transcript_9794/g.24416  ORF Transcript_9794/g.24416 Transcript_9794/m.24416 type:complete len:424 (+) Transcript_9794:58-1329(+)